MSTLQQTPLSGNSNYFEIDETECYSKKPSELVYITLVENKSRHGSNKYYVPVGKPTEGSSAFFMYPIDTPSEEDLEISAKARFYRNLGEFESRYQKLIGGSDKESLIGTFSKFDSPIQNFIDNVFLPKSDKNQLVSYYSSKLLRDARGIDGYLNSISENIELRPILEDIVANFLKTSFELVYLIPTDDYSVHAKLSHNDLSIYYEFFPDLKGDEYVDEEEEVAINIFQNKNLISSWGGGLKDSLRYIGEFRA